jgi:hypothetical protein
MRGALGNTVPSNLHDVLSGMSRSRDADDRSAGAVAIALVDPTSIVTLLGSHDNRIVTGVAALVLRAPLEAAYVAAGLLPHAADPNVRVALALCLARSEAEKTIPTATLLALVDDETPAAPLAARALASRDEDGTRDTVDALLASDDDAMRLHAALGLGRSPNTDAAGRLAAAYRFEVNPRVRWAIVSALSGHAAPIARHTLGLAAALDPDRATRSVARLALHGERFEAPPVGHDVQLFQGAAGDGLTKKAHPLSVRTPAGMDLPVVSGPDGVAVVAGLPEGSTVPVAPGNERGKDPSRGPSGDPKNDGSDERK